MVANNNILYNAALAGVSGGALTKWLTANTTAAYQAVANTAEAVAIEVDSKIAAGAYNTAHGNLLNQITAAVMTDRDIVSTNPTDYSAIAAAISSAFTAISAELLTESNYVSVATSADLATLPASSGTIVYVQANRSYWGFVSGLQAVQATDLTEWVVGIGGAWGRLNWGHPSYLRQAQFDINALTGNNNNDGILLPLSSHRELELRWGPCTGWLVATVINIQSTLNETIRLFGYDSGDGVKLSYLGAPTAVQYSGTVGTFTALNSATNQAVEMTDAAMTDFTTYLNQQVRSTSGVALNATAHIMKRIAAQQARVHPFQVYDLSAASVSITPAIVNLAVGTTYNVETLPSVNAANITVLRSNNTAAGVASALVFDRIRLVNAQTGSLFSASGGRMLVTRCQLLDTNPTFLIKSYLCGSWLNGTFVASGNQIPININGCGVAGGLNISGNTVFQRATLVQGGTGLTVTNSAQVVTEGVCVFDSSGAGVSLNGPAGRIAISAGVRIWGSGNTGVGLAVAKGQLCTYDSATKPTITGTAGDTSIAGVVIPYASIPQYDSVSGAGIITTT